MKRKISFCIPCYRSSRTIIPVIQEIDSVLGIRKDEYDYEVVAVVDGSPDDVFLVLKDYAKDKRHIKVINFAKNFSQANARMATLKYASGDYIVCLDDDGQCPMNRFWDLFEPMERGYDVSIAKYSKKKQSGFKNFGSNINKLMTRMLLDVPKDFVMSNFFIVRKYIADEMIKYTNPYPYATGLIVRATSRIFYVSMEDRKRIEGDTGYNFKKLLSLWLNGFTNFSVKPLRLSSLIGVICAIFGFIFGIVTVLRKIFLQNISVGWSSTIAIMLFIGGLIMLMLGMIGEYIGRIFICINNSPQYVIRETINVEEK